MRRALSTFERVPCWGAVVWHLVTFQLAAVNTTYSFVELNVRVNLYDSTR